MTVRIAFEEVIRKVKTPGQFKAAEESFLGMSALDKKSFWVYIATHTVMTDAEKEYFKITAFYWLANATSI